MAVETVQWARAEAEIDRFQKQMEIKLTEFLRCLTAFQFNQRAWIQMSKNSDLGLGFAELAKGTAQMWKQLSDQCQKHLTMAGFKFALESDFELVSDVERERENHDNLLREQGIEESSTPDKRAGSPDFCGLEGFIQQCPNIVLSLPTAPVLMANLRFNQLIIGLNIVNGCKPVGTAQGMDWMAIRLWMEDEGDGFDGILKDWVPVDAVKEPHITVYRGSLHSVLWRLKLEKLVADYAAKHSVNGLSIRCNSRMTERWSLRLQCLQDKNVAGKAWILYPNPYGKMDEKNTVHNVTWNGIQGDGFARALTEEHTRRTRFDWKALVLVCCCSERDGQYENLRDIMQKNAPASGGIGAANENARLRGGPANARAACGWRMRGQAFCGRGTRLSKTYEMQGYPRTSWLTALNGEIAHCGDVRRTCALESTGAVWGASG
ncbi:hypothetical protein K438DRAFT_2085956 [Mycena galopus ATCC 62051]|nr:hypothetical protein K438DRAFT_2085956 [Mycena galopus ATCC 62051]